MAESGSAQAGTPPQVAGLRLDGQNPVTISAAENAALCEAMGVPPHPGGQAHPIYYYIAAQTGMGLTVDELCRACDFDLADGPMMAGSDAQFSAPLLTGRPYRVTGEILSLDRKASRKFGTVDLLRYRLDLVGPDGALAVASETTWVLPR